MKEATGEVSMTVVTLVAIAVIGGILAVMWPQIRSTVTGLWGNGAKACAKNQYYDAAQKKCVNY